jgi:acetyl/propionyl-CoA carboxylase alpha subunit
MKMMGGAVEHRFRFQDEEHRIRLERSGESLRAIVDGREVPFRIFRREPGWVDLEVAGRRCRIHTASDGTARFFSREGSSYRLEPVDASVRPRAIHQADHGLEARMPGLVRAIPVAEGDRVERGATLVVLEAMKMEIRVTAPERGVVGRILCREGQQVDRGQVLVELDPE